MKALVVGQFQTATLSKLSSDSCRLLLTACTRLLLGYVHATVPLLLHQQQNSTEQANFSTYTHIGERDNAVRSERRDESVLLSTLHIA